MKDKYYSKVNEDKRVLIEMARISTGKIKTTLRRIQYVEKTNTSLLNSSSMGTASRATTTSSKSTWKPNPFTPVGVVGNLSPNKRFYFSLNIKMIIR